MLLTKSTVSEIALAHPGAARIFEQFHIDYCCGGRTSLAEACVAAGVEVLQIKKLLAQLGETNDSLPVNWSEVSLTALIDHIESTHHVFTRQEIERLSPLLEKVCGVHSAAHPELLELENHFRALCNELGPHLRKEENVLFPYIRALTMVTDGQPPPLPPFGTVRNPVRMMSLEHDKAGQLLREMRAMSDNYQVPLDVCASFQAVYLGLAGFEKDLHQHIHLENNVLFPRAIVLEDTLLRPPA